MAKFKPVRAQKRAPSRRPNAIGCILLLVLIFGFIYLVMYYSVKPG
jgi:hypothetical protein